MGIELPYKLPNVDISAIVAILTAKGPFAPKQLEALLSNKEV